MDKQGIYKLLEDRHLWHEVFTHKAVYNMAEMATVSLPYPKADAKNLFVRDDKHDADGELFARSAVRGRAAAAHKAEHEAEGKGEQGEGFGDFFHVKSSFQLKIFVGSYKAGGQ